MKNNRPIDWLEFTKQSAAERFWKEVFNRPNQPITNQENINKFMDPSINDSIIRNNPFPRCDMYEKGEYLFIEVEFPGIAQDDFSIQLKGQDLTISGKYSTFKPKLRYYLKEREDRSFEKTIILPAKVNNAGIHSNLENGLLTIAFPIISEEDAVPIYIDLANATFANQNQPFER